MKSCEESRYDRFPRFYPPLIGCVARDMGLCRMLCGLWADTFSALRRSLEGGLWCLSQDRILGDALYRDAMDTLEEMRILGELIMALGGGTLPEGRIGRKCRFLTPGDLILALVKDKMQRIDLYETVMAHTSDRVVRSVISGLIGAQRSAIGALQGALKAEVEAENSR